jgi:diguanylate cyclase (GGDEF)-like protein
MNTKNYIPWNYMARHASEQREHPQSPFYTTMKILPGRKEMLIGVAKAVPGARSIGPDTTFPERRAQAPPLFRKALRPRKNAAKIRVGLNAEMEAHLREANENLVIATLNALMTTEAAERTGAQLSYMVEHDQLTGLPNRALLTDRLAQAITLALRHDHKVALMFIDIDNFKRINDSMGHAVGDQLLQSVANRLQANVRNSDTVSRQGGDEFVVLLPEVEHAQSAVLSAEKLIESVSQPHFVGGHHLHVTLSIGISLYPDHGAEAESLMRNADTAMYHAKRSGRNNCKIYTLAMDNRLAMRKSVEQALRRALAQHEFVVYYQQKLNLATGAVTGAEALLRWQRSDRSLHSPAQFIRIAEDCGLILPIGKWVFREACRQAQDWLRNGFNVDRIAVNVSAIEFHSKNFLADVRSALDDTGLDPHHLEIELAENVLLQDTHPTLKRLYALKDLGVQIAVDDFGTGHAGMSFLRDFPIDSIKIDQSFVQDTGGDPGKAMITALIAMGRSFDQRIVAEGIETPQQLAFLQAQHCAEGQGYYFGRPMTAEAFTALLAIERDKGPSGNPAGSVFGPIPDTGRAPRKKRIDVLK